VARTKTCLTVRIHCTALYSTLSEAQEAVAMEIRLTLWVQLDDLLVVVRKMLNPAALRSGLPGCWGTSIA